MVGADKHGLLFMLHHTAMATLQETHSASSFTCPNRKVGDTFRFSFALACCCCLLLLLG